MKKSLIILALLCFTQVWAAHIFSICYYNQTSQDIPYNNDGISHNWKDRGGLVGHGTIQPLQNKCFQGITDETIFTSHYITFSVDNKWVGIVNPAWSHPYIIAQGATSKKGGKCTDHTEDGHDNYNLYIFATNAGLVYSNSSDINNKDDQIIPRKFK